MNSKIKLANSLKNDFEMSYYEAFRIAVEIERNEIIKEAFGVATNKHPAFLEAIAMTLGMESNGQISTVPGSLNDIADAIREKD